MFDLDKFMSTYPIIDPGMMHRNGIKNVAYMILGKKGSCKATKESFENNLNKYGEEYPNPICFAFFDSDFYNSIIDSFNKTWNKIPYNGRIVV